MMFEKGQPPTILVPQMDPSNRNPLLPAMFPISVAPILIPAQPSININTTLTPSVFPTNVTAISLPSQTTLEQVAHNMQGVAGRNPATSGTGQVHIHTHSSGDISNAGGFISPYIPINVTVQPQVINFPATSSMYIKTEPQEFVGHSSNQNEGCLTVSQENLVVNSGKSIVVYDDNGCAVSRHANLEGLVQYFDQSQEKKQDIHQLLDSSKTDPSKSAMVKPEPVDILTSNLILDGLDIKLHEQAQAVQYDMKISPNSIKSDEGPVCIVKDLNEYFSNQVDTSSSPEPCPIQDVNTGSASPDAPDTSALTTLAIVCDNVGSGRESQYVVEVQLEEPAPQAASQAPKKHSKKSHHKQKDKSKSRSELVKEVPHREVKLEDLALTSSSEDEVDVSRVSDDDPSPAYCKTPDIKLARGFIKRSGKKKRAKTTKVKGLKVLTDSLLMKKEALKESKASTSTKKSKSQDDSTAQITKAKKKDNTNSLNLPIIGGRRRKLRVRGDDLHSRLKSYAKGKKARSSVNIDCSLDDILKNLNSDTDSPTLDHTQSAANMSPASTIPYGEDSNDSVDFTGRSMYQCTECIKSYTSERRLRLHIGLIHQESDKSPLSSIFSCKLCTKAYTSQKRLDLHVLLVHEQHSKYSSSSSSSASSSQKRKHATEIEKNIDNPATDSDADIRDTVEVNQRSSSTSVNNIANSCNQCGKKYSTQERLNLHIALIHGTGKVSHLNSKTSGHVSKKIKKEAGINSSVMQSPLKTKIKKEPGEVDDEPVRMKRPYFSCSGCSLIFTDKHLYQEHLPMHDGEKKFNPKRITSKTFIKKYYLNYNNGGRRIQCLICDGDFTDERSGCNHVRNIHGIYDVKDQRISCRYCGKIFTKKQFLARHLTVHIDIGNIATHVKKYECSDCHKDFTQKAHLSRHIRLKHVDADLVRVFKCDLCGRSFKLKAHLKRHILLHEGKLPFKCSICSTTFADRNSLRIHIRVHTGERPFECPHCDHAFALKNNLNNHIINIHPEKLDPKVARKHQCLICGKICHKGGLKLHIKTHDPEKTHKCDLCPRMYKSRFQKHVHMRGVHKHHPWFYCDQCGKECSSRTALNKHMEKH